MESLQNIRPRLIEPGVKYFLNSSLEQCNIFKTKYYNFLYNLGMFIALSLVVGITLYVKYTNKNNIKLQEEKKRQEREYIMNKLRFMQDYRKNQIDRPMSDLSTWQNNPDVQFYNKKIFS